MNKLIVTIAQTGSVPTREKTPNAPLTPQEIAKDICDCYERGAAVTHIHARDENLKPSQDAKHFKQILDLLDEVGCPIIRQLTTSGRVFKDYSTRAQVLTLKPEMASLTTGSVNFSSWIYENEPALIEYLADTMYKNNIKPEIEVFDTGMIQNALELKKKGLLKDPIQFNFVMGIKGAMTATPKNLLHCVEMLPSNSTWQVAVVGPAHVQMSTMAIAMGGNVRVGLEDNLSFSKGVLATNAMMMDRITAIAKAYGRELATPDEAREMLGLA